MGRRFGWYGPVAENVHTARKGVCVEKTAKTVEKKKQWYFSSRNSNIKDVGSTLRCATKSGQIL